jgi:hypothetical protein
MSLSLIEFVIITICIVIVAAVVTCFIKINRTEISELSEFFHALLRQR